MAHPLWFIRPPPTMEVGIVGGFPPTLGGGGDVLSLIVLMSALGVKGVS
jgi:hypothetical protein